MRAVVSLVSSLLLATSLVSCSTDQGGKIHDAPAAPPQPPSSTGASEIAKGSDAVSVEIRQAVSDQLECPVDQLNIICVTRDRSGECIAVRALGCDKEMEFQFGND